ncbi:MAG: penicillin-binding protein 2 [Patescibacteria group bacterium]
MPRTNPFDIVPPAGLGRSRVVRAFRSFEYSDTTLDAQASDSPTLKHQMLPNRLRILSGFFIVLIAVLIGRGVWLQLIRGASMRSAAEGNRLRVITTTAPRGILYDRNGVPLVENVAEFTFGVVPADVPRNSEERSARFQHYQNLSGIPAQDFATAYANAPETSTEVAAVLEHVSYDAAMKLRIRLQDEPAAQVVATPRRHYLAGTAFSQVLGYTGKISQQEWKDLNATPQREYRKNEVIGKTGLEAQYEKELRGTSAKASVEVNAQRREQKVITTEVAVAGQNLVTTLDAGLQDVLATSAVAMVRQLHTTGAAVVAIDPRDGGVLAFVSVPTYDSNDFVAGLTTEKYQGLVDDPRRPLYFRPLSGEYPSGSTIKPIIATAALNEGVITQQTTVLSTGGIKIDKWFFPDWKAGGHGVTNVYKAIADSVNTFFYTIGGGTDTFEGLGIDRMTQYARTFGLGAPTGIDLPGERGGFLPSKAWKEQAKNEPWYIGDTYHFAIGQGDLLVTPLQMALATATLANGGILYKPHVAKTFQIGDGTEAKNVEATVVREHVASAEAVQIVRDAMREAVINGSARRLQTLGIPTAGKTGTAQFGNAGKTHAWFVGFAPFDNPTIAIAVMVEAGGEGHAAALPIAEAGFKFWLQKSQKTP